MKRRNENRVVEFSPPSLPPHFSYMCEKTHVCTCMYVFAFRETISVHKKRFEAGAYKFKWLVAKATGMVNIHWPGLSSPRRTLVVRSWRYKKGTRARLLCPLLDPYLPTAFRNGKLLAAQKRSRNAILIGRNERWTRNNYERQTRLRPEIPLIGT